MNPHSDHASDKSERPARGLTFEERKARATELMHTQRALPTRARDKLEMQAKCDGAESMSGFPMPKRKWDAPRERRAIPASKRVCAKCGGPHVAIACDRRR